MSKKTKHPAPVPSPRHTDGGQAQPQILSSWTPKGILGGALVAWGFMVLYHYYFKQNAPFEIQTRVLGMILDPAQYANIFSFKALAVWAGYLGRLLVLGLILFSAWSLGNMGLRALGISLPRIEQVVFGTGLGLGILSYAVFLLGCVKAYTGFAFWILLLAPCAMGLKRLKEIRQQTQEKVSGVRFSIFEKACFLFFSLQAGLNLLGALSPEIFYDSLVYHLAAPNYYLQHKSLAGHRFNVLFNMPEAMSMLYLLGLGLWDEILAKLIHASTGILISLSIFAMTQKLAGRAAGVLAATLFYVSPMVAMNLWTTAIDVALGTFEFLALWSALNVMRSPPEDTGKKRWLILTGIFAGLSMSTKYPGVFNAAILTFILFWQLSRQEGWRRAVKGVLLYGAVAALVLSPWLARNAVIMGNPVHPYFHSFFHGKTAESEKLRSLVQDTRESPATSLKEMLTGPWTRTMKGNSNASFIGPLFLFLLPLLFAGRILSRELLWMWIYLGLFFFLWSFSSGMLRFFLPALAPCAVLLAAFLAGLEFPQPFRLLMFAGVFYSFFGNLYWSSLLWYQQGGWKVLTARLAPEDYLSHSWPSYPPPPYAAFRYANENLPATAKVMLLGEARSHGLKRDMLVSTAHDNTPFCLWAEASQTPQELREKVRDEKVTHILVNLTEGRRLHQSYRMLKMSPSAQEIARQFWDLYIKEIYGFTEILEPEYCYSPQLLSYYRQAEARGEKIPMNFVALYEVRAEPRSLTEPSARNLLDEIVR